MDAFICPLKIELKHILQFMNDHSFPYTEVSIGKIQCYKIQKLDSLFLMGGHGKVEFGIRAQHILEKDPTIDRIFCIGTSGSLSKDLKIGDVVIASSTVEHDFKSIILKQKLPSFESHSETVNSILNQNTLNDSFTIHKGIIASGDEDIIDIKRRNEIVELTGALTVAWEGAGGARVCAFHKKPFVEIRAITDCADNSAPSDFMLNIKQAMYNIGKLIISWKIR